MIFCVKFSRFYFFLLSEFDITSGHTGYPLVSCEIRLIDWEEGQYKTSDKPNPRGEVLIGGKVVAKEYIGDEAAKENVNFKEIDGTRYFCTGDIGEVFPDGTLKIVGQWIFFRLLVEYLIVFHIQIERRI